MSSENNASLQNAQASINCWPASDFHHRLLEDAVRYVRNYLGKLAEEADGDQFSLDEAEVTIQVTNSGKVTIVLADVGGSIQGGIKLKWKRKPK